MTRRLAPLALGFFVGFLVGKPALSQDDPALFAYGEFLAAQCVACHGAQGGEGSVRSGAPDIWSLPFDTFRRRLLEGKATSTNDTLRLTVASLTRDELDALLYYFSRR